VPTAGAIPGIGEYRRAVVIDFGVGAVVDGGRETSCSAVLLVGKVWLRWR